MITSGWNGEPYFQTNACEFLESPNEPEKIKHDLTLAHPPRIPQSVSASGTLCERPFWWIFKEIGLRVVKLIAGLIQFEPCSQKSNSVVRQSKIHSQIGQLSMYDSVSCRIQRFWKNHTVATEAHMDQKISMYDTHHQRISELVHIVCWKNLHPSCTCTLLRLFSNIFFLRGCLVRELRSYLRPLVQVQGPGVGQVVSWHGETLIRQCPCCTHRPTFGGHPFANYSLWFFTGYRVSTHDPSWPIPKEQLHASRWEVWTSISWFMLPLWS